MPAIELALDYEIINNWPRGRFPYMLQPVALTLAMTAQDRRNDKATRDRCHQILSGLRPGSIMAIALGADYGAESLDFLRRFEADFDISCMFRWIDEFSKRMRGLFLEARVLQELPDVEDEMQTCASSDEVCKAVFATLVT